MPKIKIQLTGGKAPKLPGCWGGKPAPPWPGRVGGNPAPFWPGRVILTEWGAENGM